MALHDFMRSTTSVLSAFDILRKKRKKKEELVQIRTGRVPFFLPIFHSRHAASMELHAGGLTPYLSMDWGGDAGGRFSFFLFFRNWRLLTV